MSWKFGFPLKNIEIILTILIKRVKQIIITNILQKTKKTMESLGGNQRNNTD